MREVTAIKPRKPILAAIAAFGAPGLGQLYNGQMQNALALYLLTLASFPIVSLTSLGFRLPGIAVLLIVALGFFVWIIIDAWLNAKKLAEYELRKWNRWYVYLGIILVHLIVLVPLIEYLFPRPIKAFKVPSGAMLPTIQIGDHIIVDLTAYNAAKPKRGDIVVFVYPEDHSKDFIKRIIGLPAETIEIKQKKVLINGKPLDEPWGIYDGSDSDMKERDNFNHAKIPENEYFMMGDNRDRSYDSRFWGFVHASALKGKALYIYWATDKSRIGHRFH